MPASEYEDALGWLYGRQALGIKLGLDNMERLLARLGDPQQSFHAIHIAGTNGKGTVARYLHDALRRTGARTGLYTSPHLVRFAERIVIDEEATPAQMVALVDRVRPVVEAMDSDDTHPTFFEVVTALAFLHFQDEGVEWAVVETGLGGRLDATNVLAPELTIITTVDFDHQDALGPTLESIAAEKAGIMKPGIPVVTATDGIALEVIHRRSHDLSCAVSTIGRDYTVVPAPGGFALQHPQGAAQYEVAAPGRHQLTNAALAVAAWDALRARGHAAPPAAIQQALATVRPEGRLERIQRDGRDILLDGAHNLAGAAALRVHLADLDWGGFHLIVGFQADKDWQSMLGQWAPLAARITAVPLRSGRSLDPHQVVAAAPCPAEVAPDVRTALERAAGPQVVVAGSLWLVGDARAVLTGQALEGETRDQ